MDYFTSLFEFNSDDWRPTLLWFLFLFFLLAAFGTLIWWILFADGEEETASSSTNDATSRNHIPFKEQEQENSGEWSQGAPWTAPEQPDTQEDAADESLTDEDLPAVPTEAEIGQRASELANWRAERGIAGSSDDDWILAERELYSSACGLNANIDRRKTYQGDRSRQEIPGVNSEDANELGRLGFSDPQSLSNISDSDKSRIDRWFKSRGKDEIDWQAIGSSSTSNPPNEVIAKEFAGEPVQSDPDLGVIYQSTPANPDDLTEINGIGPTLESRLNENGVYRFKQIANWQPHNVEQFEQRLSFSGRIGRDEWIPQAQNLARSHQELSSVVEEPEPDLPDATAYAGFEEKYTDETVRVDEKLGIVFEQTAHCEDDLTQVKGIGKVLQKTLNERGVYRFQQIADWNEYNVWSFNRIISFPGRIQRDEWISQAEELALTSRCTNPGSARVSSGDLETIISDEFHGEDVEIREPFGIVYKSPPAEGDNLQDIRGVGPVLEKKLHDFGVYRFKQIANWPDDAIDEFQEQLSFPDRIRRDDWVGQCVKLTGL